MNAVKRHMNSLSVARYSVWLMNELAVAGFAEDVRRAGGLWVLGMVSTRYFDNSMVSESAASTCNIVMESCPESHTEKGKIYLRDLRGGRAVGGGSVDEELVIKVTAKYEGWEGRSKVLGVSGDTKEGAQDEKKMSNT